MTSYSHLWQKLTKQVLDIVYEIGTLFFYFHSHFSGFLAQQSICFTFKGWLTNIFSSLTNFDGLKHNIKDPLISSCTKTCKSMKLAGWYKI